MLRIGDKVKLAEGVDDSAKLMWKGLFDEQDVVVKKYNPEQTIFYIGVTDSELEVLIRSEQIQPA